jgi:hypothetical protein
MTAPSDPTTRKVIFPEPADVVRFLVERRRARPKPAIEQLRKSRGDLQAWRIGCINSRTSKGTP